MPQTNKKWTYYYYPHPHAAWWAAAILWICPSSEPVCNERPMCWRSQAFRRTRAGSWTQRAAAANPALACPASPVRRPSEPLLIKRLCRRHQGLLEEQDRSHSSTLCQCLRLSSGQFIHYSVWLTLLCHTCNWFHLPFPKMLLQIKILKLEGLSQSKTITHAPMYTSLQNTFFLLLYSNI